MAGAKICRKSLEKFQPVFNFHFFKGPTKISRWMASAPEFRLIGSIRVTGSAAL
jgi:hypothetical protein